MQKAEVQSASLMCSYASFSGYEWANVHVEGFVVCRMAQDVGMVQKCIVVSFLSCLAGFEGSIPTYACFHSENVFVL